MESPYLKGIEFFKKRVNLLIVDDDPHLRSSLMDTFDSPLFNTSCIATLGEAYKTIGQKPDHWHCWIVDIDLGNGQNGLDLLSRYPRFPFVVVLSGLHSMSLSAEAMKLGARHVFDKDPRLIDRLHKEVCTIAALGYVLKGAYAPDLDIFLLLQDQKINSIEQWAEKASLQIRQLHRACELYPPLTPRLALVLYRVIFFFLYHSAQELLKDAASYPAFPSDESPDIDYNSAIDFIFQKMVASIW